MVRAGCDRGGSSWDGEVRRESVDDHRMRFQGLASSSLEETATGILVTCLLTDATFRSSLSCWTIVGYAMGCEMQSTKTHARRYGLDAQRSLYAVSSIQHSTFSIQCSICNLQWLRLLAVKTRLGCGERRLGWCVQRGFRTAAEAKGQAGVRCLLAVGCC